MALAPFGSYAICPLTVFDHLFQRSTFVTGWLLEGDIDTRLLSSALARVTDKWRLLAGRLDCSPGKDERGKEEWFIRIPLGQLHPSYSTYVLTEVVSEEPLSTYLTVPLGFSSLSLPSSIFIHSSTPRSYDQWKSRSHPLTHWHITRFPATESGKTYTCLGFARSHGIFDAGGAAMIVNAVISEVNGREWPVPPIPVEGLNVNPLQIAIDKVSQKYQGKLREYQDYRVFTPLSGFGAVKMVAWHVRELWWRKARSQIFIVPEAVISTLVQSVRDSLREKYQDSIQVSTGDVLVAWLTKTIYSSGTPSSKIIHCTNVGSFRTLLSSEDESIPDYPHNAFVPLPYPLLSVAELNNLPLPELVRQLTMSRSTFSIGHVLVGSHTMQNNSFTVPYHGDADEIFLVSNVSASRILQADWSCIGASGTACGYRYSCAPTGLLVTNSAYISGRLADSSFVFDVTLNENRMNLLSLEVQRIMDQAAQGSS